MANTERIPKPGVKEKFWGTIALMSGIFALAEPAAIFATTFIANLADAEILEIPTFIAAFTAGLPAELPDLGVFLYSLEKRNTLKARRENIKKEEMLAHKVVATLRPHHERSQAARAARRNAA